MNIVFAIISLLTLGGAIAAMSLRNLVHCALALMVGLLGLAVLYLQLDAQFVGFAQILVYIGAVAILIVFAILLTRNTETSPERLTAAAPVLGIGIAVLVFGSLTTCIFSSVVTLTPTQPKADVAADVAIKNIGSELMTEFVLPFEVIALLLTAALIGAVVIAMHKRTVPDISGQGTAGPRDETDSTEVSHP